jgi:hypothetical protein
MDNRPWGPPTLAVQRMRIILPVPFQLHRVRAEAEPAARNTVGVGNHGETCHIEWVSSSALRRPPKDGAIAPAELTYYATARCIQGELRLLMLKHQIANVACHLRWRGTLL